MFSVKKIIVIASLVVLSQQSYASNRFSYPLSSAAPNLSVGAVTSVDGRGFGGDGIHTETGTQYDAGGFDVNGNHQSTGTPYNPDGFDVVGNHQETGTTYAPDGYDAEGYDVSGNSTKICQYRWSSGGSSTDNYVSRGSTLYGFIVDGDYIGASSDILVVGNTTYSVGRGGSVGSTSWLCTQTARP
jgi:hypothetical protein